MGARIEAVATALPAGRRKRGSIALADRAAELCLERAGLGPRDVDFLINAGIYRDHNVGEPAIAAIIQEDIGANPDPPLEGGHGTFSFDVANGACGALTAMQILDGFIASGAIEHGLVVASDAPPEGRDRRSFPFASVGGAVLLAPSAVAGTGFTHFASVTFPEHAHLFEARLEWEQTRVPKALADHVPGVRAGRQVLHIAQHGTWAEVCAACGVAAARDFLRELGLPGHEVGLLVASPTPDSFPDELSRALEVPAARVARVGERYAGAHTAGLIAALEEAEDDRMLDAAGDVLLVAVGSGITVSLALYRPAPRRPA